MRGVRLLGMILIKTHKGFFILTKIIRLRKQNPPCGQQKLEHTPNYFYGRVHLAFGWITKIWYWSDGLDC
jgi:hypothetical protein